jgi:riboflavin kinase/FMN adenylyltransferase
VQVLRQPGDARPLEQGCVATIGAFDGVHLGHRQLIRRVRDLAEQRGTASAVVTFDRHPASVVRPDSAPLLLTDLDQKLELLAETGIDYTVVVQFDKDRVHESAQDFVSAVLVDLLHARAIIVGSDFHFGYRRTGNVALLERLGAQAGFDVTGLTLFDQAGRAGGEAVSSTRIRALLSAGDVVGAAALLGRFHEVRGVVGHGDQRGRQLGYPTANVAVPSEIIMPSDGVFAGWYERPDGLRRPAALSLGRRPTFYEEADLSLLEAYLLDFDGDLYNEAARVSFVAPLRGQMRFGSAGELIEQMGRDVDATRDVLEDQ